jgi:hypothetical protein
LPAVPYATRAVPRRARLAALATRRVRAGPRQPQKTERPTGTATASVLRPTPAKAPPTAPASVRTDTPARATDQMASTRPSRLRPEPFAMVTRRMENLPPSPLQDDPMLHAPLRDLARIPVRVLTRAAAASPRFRLQQKQETVRATASRLRPIGDRRSPDKRNPGERNSMSKSSR